MECNDLLVSTVLQLIETGVINLEFDGEKLTTEKCVVERKKKEPKKKESDIDLVYSLSKYNNINLTYNIYLKKKRNIYTKEKKKSENETLAPSNHHLLTVNDNCGTVNTCDCTDNLDKQDNLITINLIEFIDKISLMFKNYNYNTKFHKSSTIKRIVNIVNNKNTKLRLNPNQILYAYMGYLYEMKESGRESQYIKGSEVFLSNAVYDYVEKTKNLYESKMQEKYGDEWGKVKFKLTTT